MDTMDGSFAAALLNRTRQSVNFSSTEVEMRFFTVLTLLMRSILSGWMTFRRFRNSRKALGDIME